MALPGLMAPRGCMMTLLKEDWPGRRLNELAARTSSDDRRRETEAEP